MTKNKIRKETVTLTDNKQKIRVRKGQIYTIKDDPIHLPIGSEMWANRPAIIVSNDTGNKYSDCVLVIYLTTKVKTKMPTHIDVKSKGRTVTALCEQIHTVDKSRIDEYVGTITDEELVMIDKALLLALGISNSLKPTYVFKKWESYVNKYGLEMGCGDEKDRIITQLKNELKKVSKQRDTFQLALQQLCEHDKTKCG